VSSDRADNYRALLAEVYELAGYSRRQSHIEAAAFGSTAARWLAMSAISDGPMTVASIARRLGLPRQAVHRVVVDLVAHGHAEKLANPDHSRSELVTLTDEGRSVQRNLARASDDHRSAVLAAAAISDRELEMTRDVLRRILEVLRAQASAR
jgi:DNA-binding MarR family transcriptional regulator